MIGSSEGALLREQIITMFGVPASRADLSQADDVAPGDGEGDQNDPLRVGLGMAAFTK
jgi:hypothetical protein